jgi:type I restriction enzyme M protein
VPREARWSHLRDNAKQPTVGRMVDDAMVAIERDNPSLKGVLPKDYARPGLDPQRLGQLIDLITNVRMGPDESVERRAGTRVHVFPETVRSRRGTQGRAVLDSGKRR